MTSDTNRPTFESTAERVGRLADTFGRAGKSLVRAFDDRLGERGGSTPRSKLLVEVLRMEPVRLADLARAVGITQGTASTLADALVKDGLIARTTDEKDRRAIRLTTTTAGAERARRWLADYKATAEELFGCLDADEQALLARLLDRLAEALSTREQTGSPAERIGRGKQLSSKETARG